MKTTFLKTTFLLVAILTFFNCSNNDDPQDQLPPITQTGANTFGCIINGEVFVPKDSGPSTTPGGGILRGLTVIRGISYSSIGARNKYIYIYVYVPESTPQEITYNFQSSNGRTGTSAGNSPSCYVIINDVVYLSYTNSGTINFSKVDDNQGVISGTFSLKLKNRDNENDIIEITEGRFDI